MDLCMSSMSESDLFHTDSWLLFTLKTERCYAQPLRVVMLLAYVKPCCNTSYCCDCFPVESLNSICRKSCCDPNMTQEYKQCYWWLLTSLNGKVYINNYCVQTKDCIIPKAVNWTLHYYYWSKGHTKLWKLIKIYIIIIIYVKLKQTIRNYF